ncbi:MAG: hypothetical protein LBK74_08480 [Treponema sp.]|jgi:hypothetical protein|nr:hypothetical protein [Treponema sp.]
MDKRRMFCVARAALAAAFAVCAGGLVTAQTGNGPERPPVLYVAGNELDAATVWKIDGSRVTPIPLAGGKRYSKAEGIAESGGSIYVAGYEYNSGAMVWKIDGSRVTPIPLTDGTRESSARAIVESGGGGPGLGPERPPVLYAAGYEESGPWIAPKVAMVWKIDGSTVTPIPLTDGTDDSIVRDIVESGGSIYAAGDEGNAAMVWKIDGSTITPTPLPVIEGGTTGVLGIVESGGSIYAVGNRTPFIRVDPSITMVWKIDGSGVTPIPLTDEMRDARAEAVIESAGSIYVAGYERDSGGRVWKIDGSTVTRSIALSGETRETSARAIVESGGSLYAAGVEKAGGSLAVRVWKIDGSTVTAIPLTDGEWYSGVEGIAESGGSIYAAGSERATALVWKIDGFRVTPIPLTDGTRESSASGIVESEASGVIVHRE